jgi:hypothetical protein
MSPKSVLAFAVTALHLSLAAAQPAGPATLAPPGMRHELDIKKADKEADRIRQMREKQERKTKAEAQTKAGEKADSDAEIDSAAPVERGSRPCERRPDLPQCKH